MYIKHKIYSAIICFLLFVGAVNAQDNSAIKAWAVNLDKGEASPLFKIKTEGAENGKVKWKDRVYIQPEITFQEIEGIGGAFNEIGGEAFMSLSKKEQKTIMNHLFSKDGAGFTFCRTAIGASDFGIDAYSYSNVADDYKMKHFSVERDKKYVLPYIQSALKVNKDLTIFGSPWSPPAWLKESGQMEGLKGKPNKLRDEKKIKKAYAQYFVKYVQEYKKNGVNIDRICVQNENDADTKYPSCVFPAKEMIAFADDYLIPAFEKNKINTKVYAGTFRAVNKIDLFDFVQHSKDSKIEGVGIQYTEAHFITDAKALKPDLKIFHTEGHCYNGKNSSEQAKDRLEEVANYINSGSATFTYWNMILNETTKSGWDWTQNSLININRANGQVVYNPDYNAMYIISKFIQPGDVRIASVNRGEQHPTITVKSPDGTIKLLVQNTNEEERTFEIAISNQTYKLNLPPHAISAIVVDGNKLK